MNYTNVKKAVFLSRPNRFIAEVELEGEKQVCHVKNTGRCRELLVPGAQVWVCESQNPARKTRYDLICVQKGKLLINMDAQAPNQAAQEWLEKKELFPGLTLLRPETVHGGSRFDFYLEEGDRRIFLEVKGVTLEEDGAVRFPDAPTERGVRHIRELERCLEEGYEAYLLFVIQMKGAYVFMPNDRTHPAFGEALRRAAGLGVHILAMDCRVTPDSMTIDKPVPVRLRPEEPRKEWRPELLGQISGPLLNWFKDHARVLPWRETPSPYRVWISEIMLQQTRVEAVKPFYRRFMDALPDIRSLADCPEEKLLKLWEGLGYYNRARNLQKAARLIQERWGGEMPADYEELLSLPGIGSYTAGAVASIACGLPAPAVDGNVLRVVSRVCLLWEDILKQSVKRKVEEALAAAMPKDRPGDFNQALMELGATVCVPGGPPRCGECPLEGICLAEKEGVAEQLPVKAAKKPRRVEERTVLVILDGERAAIGKRPKKGLLAGLYELPNVEGSLSREEVLKLLQGLGLTPLHIEELPRAKHIFSHIEWHMTGYAVRVAEHEEKNGHGLLFVKPEETEKKYPIPAAFSAYTDYLHIRLGQEKYNMETVR